MGFFSDKKISRKLVLLFDIGSSSVGGAVFELQKSGIPKIILSIREPIVLEENIDTKRFLLLTIKALEVVANKICLMGIGKPHKIFCVLSSPWYASQIRTIKLEKNTSFLLNKKFVDNLIQKEISLFEEENLSKFSNTDNQVKLIEFKNMKTVLNGYPTSEPLDKKAKKIEMNVFMSIGGNKTLDEFEKIIFKHFHSKDIRFLPFVIAAYTVARDMFIHKDNFLLIDIGGEITDVSMIKKDILMDSVSYPIGHNFIIRKVAEKMNCSLREAKSLLSIYKDGHIEKSTEKKLKPIIDKLNEEWLRGFQDSLATLSSDIAIPSTIFITVDQNLVDLFSNTLKDERFNQYSLTESEFQVVFLGPSVLHGITTFKENIKRDLFIIIESIYINRFIC